MFEDKELANHFGKKVVLSNDIKDDFLRYYLLNASDEEKNKASRKVNRSISAGETYLRISKVPNWEKSFFFGWSKKD